MSQIEENSALDMDPVEQLDELKRTLQIKIASQKSLLADAKRVYRSFEKLKLEDHPDKPEKLKNKQTEIEELQKTLIAFETDLRDLNRTRDDETEEKIQAALNIVAQDYIDRDPSVAYVIADDEFVFVTDYSSVLEKQNVQLRNMPPKQFIQLLSNDLNLKAWHMPAHRLIDMFNAKKRTYQLKRYSIDPSLWQNDRVYLPIRHMEQYFIDKMTIPADQQEFVQGSLQFFDWLMYSLSGGKQENQEHIERWILHKIKNYRKAVTTPDLVIVGHVGGNGKGIIQAIFRLMLPAMLSGKANSKTLNGNFNAIMLGKLIVFFDDQNSREIPLDVVKQLAGSETMIFEPKGKDQYEGEKTHSSAWFSNRLPFRLTPAGQEGGVDRRFSITRTNLTFLESIRKHVAEQTGVEISVEDSKDYAEDIVSKYLLNRLCIAGWFRELERRHPEVDSNYTLKPLHGEDYRYFLEQQTDKLWEIFHGLIKPVVEAGGCVPYFVVKELMRLASEPVKSDKWLSKQITELASQHRLDIATEQHQIQITSGPSVSIGRRVVVVRPKKPSDWTQHSFDWTLVSRTAYTGPAPAGRPLIDEDDVVFGVTEDDTALATVWDTSTDDDDDVDDDSIFARQAPSWRDEL